MIINHCLGQTIIGFTSNVKKSEKRKRLWKKNFLAFVTIIIVYYYNYDYDYYSIIINNKLLIINNNYTYV